LKCTIDILKFDLPHILLCGNVRKYVIINHAEKQNKTKKHHKYLEKCIAVKLMDEKTDLLFELLPKHF